MNTNNTDILTTEYIKCDSPLNFCLLYFQFACAVVGFFLSLICIRVFMKLLSFKGKNNDLYRYLLIKSFSDMFILFITGLDQIFDPDDYYGEYSLKNYVDNYMFLKIVYLIIGIYFTYSLKLVSIFCEVLSVFNRYRLSTKKFEKFNKIPFPIVCLAVFLYSFGFYIYKFFSIQIKKFESNNFSQEIKYEFIIDDNLDNKMGYIHSSVRDGMCVLAIIFLNVLTIIEIKKMLQKKKNMFRDKNKHKTQLAEIRITIMVFLMSFIGVLAHSLQMVQYFSPDYFFYNKYECYIIIFDLIFNLCSYPFNFFLYYFFNLKFKRHFLNIIHEFLHLFGYKKTIRTIPVSIGVSVQNVKIIEFA